MRPVLLAILFLVLAAVSVAVVVVLVVPAIAGLLGNPADEPVSAWLVLLTLGVAIALVFAGLYAAGLVWLVVACRLFPPQDVRQLLEMGPNTRLEILVFERFSRRVPDDDRRQT